jgi:hypothetical protein
MLSGPITKQRFQQPSHKTLFIMQACNRINQLSFLIAKK